MKLSGIEVSDAVYAAHCRITGLNNDQFYEAAKALDLDVSNGMPNYRGPTPYWWETDQLSDNAAEVPRLSTEVTDHHVHLVTGREFDYDHSCNGCKFFSVRTRRKVKVVGCAQAPELDGENFGQVRESFPACDLWVDAEKPRPLKGRG